MANAAGSLKRIVVVMMFELALLLGVRARLCRAVREIQ